MLEFRDLEFICLEPWCSGFCFFSSVLRLEQLTVSGVYGGQGTRALSFNWSKAHGREASSSLA